MQGTRPRGAHAASPMARALAGETCDTFNCLEEGACCLSSGCLDTVKAVCLGVNGTFFPGQGCGEVDCNGKSLGGDLNGDNKVDSADLNILLSGFGCNTPPCVGDVDGDGDVDSTDLNVLLGNFGDTLLGACCFDAFPCEEITEDECESADGDFFGEGTFCDEVNCF